MSTFTSLDDVLNSHALAAAPSRDLGAPAADFQPLFAAGALGAGSKQRAAEACPQGPQIELVEADGRVRQIIVTCGCGERTVIDCTY